MNETENSKSDWQELYLQTEKWISDLSFYTDELRFFNTLHERYFSEMVKNENLDEIREEIMRFQDTRYACEKLLNETKVHLHQLVQVIENSGANGNAAGIVQQKHQELRQEMTFFELNFKANKKEIFVITQNVLENQKGEKVPIGQ